MAFCCLPRITNYVMDAYAFEHEDYYDWYLNIGTFADRVSPEK